MPIAIAPNALIQVRIVGQLQSQETISTFVYQWESPAPEPDFHTVTQSLKNKFTQAGGLYDLFIDCITVGWSCQYIAYQPVKPDRFVADKFIPAGTAGVVVGTDMPANVAAVIERRGDLANRQNIGSLHVPGMVVESFNNLAGVWGVAQQARLDALAVFLPAPLVDLVNAWSFLPVLTNLAVDGVVPVPITQGHAQETPRVMRRRTKGVGR